MNKQPKTSFKIIALAAFLWFVAGCASSSTPTPSSLSPAGAWATTITEENAPRFAAYIEMTFTDDGRVVVNNPGTQGPMDVGSYTFTRDQLVVTDESVECLRMGFPKGTYKWSVANDTLTLTAIDDPCYSRRKPFERTWSKKTTVGAPTPTIKPLLK